MDVKDMYNLLMEYMDNRIGVCALLGNIKAESNFNPKNLQNSANKKLGMTDDEYTDAVDCGAYCKFADDNAGYGLVQWTYPTRKKQLYNFAKSVKKSIGDAEMQLLFMIGEIKNHYTGLWDKLINAYDLADATVQVMIDYERPADRSDNVKSIRIKYATEVYNMCVAGLDKIEYDANVIVNLALSYLNITEGSKWHKDILDIYNNHTPLARGYKVKQSDAWCATFVSAVFIKAGYSKLIQTECSCAKMLEGAKLKGIWVEDDAYTPMYGDLILYDWNDNGIGDNTGNPDHVGIIESVTGDMMLVIEGNYKDRVGKRAISVNSRYIRGYITPRYTKCGMVLPSVTPTLEDLVQEIIAGNWGNGEKRKEMLEATGYDYDIIQMLVNKQLDTAAKPENSHTVTAGEKARYFDKGLSGVYKTTDALKLRDGAGTNKKLLVKMPKGAKVTNYGYYSNVGNVKWFYVEYVCGDMQYTGFCCSTYLARV